MPAVSIILPVYNGAETLTRALASIQQQRFQDYEIIAVDDCSTDESVDVLKCSSLPIRILKHTENRGAAAARNTGIAAAVAPLLAFLDCDDLWTEEKLEKQLAALNAAPEAHDISVTAAHLYLLDEGETRLHTPRPSDNWPKEILKGCSFGPGSTMMARKAAFDRAGLYDVSLPRLEDWDWLIRYTQAGGNIEIVDQPLARIHKRRGKRGEEVEQAIRLFFKKHKRLMMAEGKGFYQQILASMWLNVAGVWLRQRRRLRAVCCASRGFILAPKLFFQFFLPRRKRILSQLKRRPFSEINFRGPTGF